MIDDTPPAGFIRVADLDALADAPEPAYPEYQLIRQMAHHHRFVTRADIEAARDALAAHDARWVWAVLGYAAPTAIDVLPATEAHMLAEAHRLGLDPPLNATLAAWTAASDAARTARDAARAEARRTAQARYGVALSTCMVPVDAAVNVNSRRRGTRHEAALVHAIPAVTAMSGTARRHLSGRGLCETAFKGRVMRTAPSGGPVTCMSCLAYMTTIRPAP